NTSLIATAGAVLDVSTATHYEGQLNSERTVEARGQGSVVDLSGLTSLIGTLGTQGYTIWSTNINAYEGGRVDLSNVLSLHNQVYIRTSGQDSQAVASMVDLGSLTAFAGGGHGQAVEAAGVGQ